MTRKLQKQAWLKQFSPLATLTLLSIFSLLALSACNMPGRAATPTQSQVGQIYTAAAQTVAARLTQPAPEGSLTPAPGGNGTPVPGQPAATPGSGAPTTPGAQATAEPAAGTSTCDQAQFVDDVTVPDGTQFAPGASFVKTWRLQNTGTCTWDTSYTVIFDDGDNMGAPASLPLTAQSVGTEETVDVSIPMKAPTEPGKYQANFKLRNAAGQEFGIGPEADSFWVQIEVVAGAANSTTAPGATTAAGSPSGGGMDLIARASVAEWASGTGSPESPITFNGTQDDPLGAAAVVDQVALENGATSGKVLLTVPRQAENGFIQGIFPAYTVGSDDHFKARLGFMIPGGRCGNGSVTFQLQYKEGNDVRLLEEWDKACTRRLLPVDVNLGSLRGRTVQFILIVRANGSPSEDYAVWNSAVIAQ